MIKTTPQIRAAMYREHQAGKSYTEIAHTYALSKECVRYWCRRQRDGKGVDTVYPKRKLLSRFDPKVAYCILRLRLEHPKRGPISLINQLMKRPSLQGLELPSPAQIGRYLHQWERFRRAPKLKPETVKPASVSRSHQRWQIDFKVKIPLADGEGQLFTVVDEFSGVCIGAWMFPTPGARPRLEEVISFLRDCFNRWGLLPEEIQTDGEASLTGRTIEHPFPSRFTLWLAGLGIMHRVIPTRQPTENAEVERGHRRINEYVLISREALVYPHINQLLEQATYEFIYELPSQAKNCQGQPPAQAYPDLFTPRRPYHSVHEETIFSLQRVDAFLSEKAWLRHVAKTGQVTIGERRRYSLGRKQGGKIVLIRFDPNDRHFVFFTFDTKTLETIDEIARRPARGLEIDDLIFQSQPTLAPIPLQLPLQFVWPDGVNVNEQSGV